MTHTVYTVGIYILHICIALQHDLRLVESTTQKYPKGEWYTDSTWALVAPCSRGLALMGTTCLGLESLTGLLVSFILRSSSACVPHALHAYAWLLCLAVMAVVHDGLVLCLHKAPAVLQATARCTILALCMLCAGLEKQLSQSPVFTVPDQGTTYVTICCCLRWFAMVKQPKPKLLP